MSGRQKCSKCGKVQAMSKFRWDNKKGRNEKVCGACKRRRRKRILQLKILGQRCDECGCPPTFRDIRFAGKDILTRYKGRKLCSNCLVPHITDAELRAWMQYRLGGTEYHWSDYVLPEKVDWFGEGENSFTRGAKKFTR